jgi:nitrate/nitrite-specific signal transduction histidine kinase
MAKSTTRSAPAKRAGAGRAPASAPGRKQLERCRRLLRGGNEAARAELGALRERLAKVESEHRRLSGHFVLLEQQVTRLTFLYTAARQLLETLDRDTLVTTVTETVVNIVGSEDFALYERDPVKGVWSLAASVGEGAAHAGAPREGQGPLGALLAARQAQLAPGNGVTAFVPLCHLGEVTGALVVFHLLPHKAALEQVDRDLLSLFGSHAAQALYCARLHAVARGARP